MTTAHEQPDDVQNETYVLDTESGAEMARLMRQDQLITQGMGGIFPEKIDLTGVQRILDLACGPGGWVLETAFAYPNIQVVGADISEKMIAYAQAQAQVQHLSNTNFHVMNILQPLDFPDASFDLVNERFIVGFMQQQRWPQLVHESLRVLRPGGILRFTEVELGYSNKTFFEKAWWLVLQAMKKNGLGFSPHGLHFSIFPMLPKFFREAGVENLNKMAHVIEFSAGSEARDGFYYDFVNAFLALDSFIEKSGLVSLAEWRAIAQKGLAEMLEDDFCAVWTLLTVWGNKPMQ
jgi:ubiquinone/menaquinone biosynthesis C-methylase UbiE